MVVGSLAEVCSVVMKKTQLANNELGYLGKESKQSVESFLHDAYDKMQEERVKLREELLKNK